MNLSASDCPGAQLVESKADLNRVNLLSISTAASGQGRKILGDAEVPEPSRRQVLGRLIKVDSLVLLGPWDPFADQALSIFVIHTDHIVDYRTVLLYIYRLEQL